MAPRNTISEKKTVAKVFKLSDICLDIVCKNFHEFTNSFKHSDDDITKRRMLFLQIKFSRYFLNLFSNKKAEAPYYLKNSLFHFLLNEYLKELDTSIFQEEDWEDALYYLKDIGQSFEKVTFRYRNPSKAIGPDSNVGEYRRKRFKKSPSEDFLQKFVHVLLPLLKNVSSLTMHASARFTDETIKMIYATCKDLKELTFVGQRRISEEGLKSLCPNDQWNQLHLKSLSFPSRDNTPNLPAISENGIIHLIRNMPSLEVINYYHLPRILHKLHLGDLLNNTMSNVRKYNLTSLEIDVYENFLDDTGTRDNEFLEQTLAIVAEVCPSLKKLSLVGVADERHLLVVTKFPDLEELSITGNCDRESLDSAEVLRVSGKQLKVLRLMHIRVSVVSLLTSCPLLESLWLSYIKYTDLPEHPNLKSVRRLRDLYFEDWSIWLNPHAEKSLKLLLQSCPNLEELMFFSCKFNIDPSVFPRHHRPHHQEVNAIVGNFCEQTESLQRLTFKLCICLDPGLVQRIVSTCRSLETLVVDSCPAIGLLEIEVLRGIAKASEARIEFTCHLRRGDRIRNAEDVMRDDNVSNQEDDEADDTDYSDYDRDDTP